MSSTNSNSNSNSHQRQRFLGKVVLVTGAGSGIGRATALEFAREGASIVLSGRVESKLVETAKLIKDQFNGKTAIHAGDVALEEVNKQLVETALKRFGRLDVAVNNAAAYIFSKITEFKEADINAMLDVNIKGLIFGTKYQFPAIGKTSSPESQGVIINISSVASQHGLAGTSVYGATKGFIDSFSTAMAVEGVEYNVRVNSVLPGVTISEGAVGLFGGVDKLEELSRTAGLNGKAATSQEIGEFIVHVASTRYLNGSKLVIDNGFLVK